MKPGSIVKQTTLDGKEVLIRYLTWEDLDQLLAFANALSQEDTFVQLSGETVSRTSEMDYITNALRKVEMDESVHLVAYVDGVFAANASIVKGAYRRSHTGLLAIAVAKDFRDITLGSLLMNELIREAPRIGISLVELTCLSNNPRAMHVYEKSGFTKCGVIPGAIKYRSAYVDEVYFYKNIGGLIHKGGA